MAEDAWDSVERSDLSKAETTLRNALKGREGDCVLWNDLGLVLWQKGELKESEKMFRTALLVRPDYEDGKLNLACLLASRGFYRQALRIVEELAQCSQRAEIYRRKAEEYRRLAEMRKSERSGEERDESSGSEDSMQNEELA